MARVTRSNPAAALRWSPERAAREFGLTTNTLRKALNKDSPAPDKDGLYSTEQICGALFGIMHREKIRTQRQVADRITLENQITRGEMLNRAGVQSANSARIWIAQRIKSHSSFRL
jgi:hypothetical protein